VNTRRLIFLGLGAVALLAVVALAARGGSLHSGGSGSGPSVPFWNYAFTTLVALEVIAAVAAVWVLAGLRPRDVGSGTRAQGRSPRQMVFILIGLIAFAALLFYVRRYLYAHPDKGFHFPVISTPSGPKNLHRTNPSQQLALQWKELVGVLVLVAVGVAAYVISRKRLGQNPRLRRTPPEVVAAALDESLDDLRTDPDLRRAIVAAYARMEKALAVVGLPRDPAEAPLEYVERVLLSLDASAEAVRRLTDLFEWARFSHHELEGSMRDEAIDALVAVRDELRSAELQPA